MPTMEKTPVPAAGEDVAKMGPDSQSVRNFSLAAPTAADSGRELEANSSSESDHAASVHGPCDNRATCLSQKQKNLVSWGTE